jgi:hypothetical protein
VVGDADHGIMAQIDRQYLARPYYGLRRMVASLDNSMQSGQPQRRPASDVNDAPVANLPASEYEHASRGTQICPSLPGAPRSSQPIWCSDITYIPLAKGFLYLVVIVELGEPRRAGVAAVGYARHRFLCRGRSRKRSSGTAGPRFSMPTRACPREKRGVASSPATTSPAC